MKEAKKKKPCPEKSMKKLLEDGLTHIFSSFFDITKLTVVMTDEKEEEFTVSFDLKQKMKVKIPKPGGGFMEVTLRDEKKIKERAEKEKKEKANL